MASFTELHRSLKRGKKGFPPSRSLNNPQSYEKLCRVYLCSRGFDTAVTLCVMVGGTGEHKGKGLNTESHCCLFETSVSVTAFVCGPSQHSQKKKKGRCQ